MKKLFLIAVLVLSITKVSAQEQGKIRGGANLGLAFPNAGIGFAADLDFRYNITYNINAGLLLTSFGGVKDITTSIDNSLTTMTVGASTGTLLHGDYYFNNGTNNFAPFLGAGLGSFRVSNIQITSNDETNAAGSISASDQNKLGGVIRTGFEAGHFRVGLSYYLIAPSSLYNLLATKVGSTGNNYLNLTLGFYLGGGNWAK